MSRQSDSTIVIEAPGQIHQIRFGLTSYSNIVSSLLSFYCPALLASDRLFDIKFNNGTLIDALVPNARLSVAEHNMQ